MSQVQILPFPSPRCEASGVLIMFVYHARGASGSPTRIANHYSLFTIHYSLTMIYAPVTTPAQLLAALPGLLENEQEAAELLDQLKEEIKPKRFQPCEEDIHLDRFEQDAHTYSSVYEAFRELYSGDIDEFKRDTCEDYGICTSDFGDYYADWLDSNYSTYYIGKKKLIILY